MRDSLGLGISVIEEEAPRDGRRVMQEIHLFANYAQGVLAYLEINTTQLTTSFCRWSTPGGGVQGVFLVPDRRDLIFKS